MSRFRRRSAAFRLALPVLALGFALAGPLHAQPEPEGAEEVEVEPPARVSVVGRFGTARFARWLTSEDTVERLRAIERLGEVGTATALATITVYAFERRGQLLGREWLTLARTLAPHAADPKAQLALAMLVNQSPRRAAGPEEAALLELARSAAALALADEGGASSLLVLGRALRASGAPAAASADALIAHPPVSLAPLLDVPGEPSVELATLLGALADQRAFHALRGWVRGKGSDVRAASARALTRLGDMETVPLAALWLEQGSPELRHAALEILLLAHDPRAEPALRARVADGTLDPAEQRRLLEFPSPALEAAVLAAIDRGGPDAGWRWTLLGRIGGDAAAQRLARGLGDENVALVAAHALSRLPGNAAHSAVQARLDGEAVRPIAVRVAAARAALAGERFAGLDERASAWLLSKEPRERAAGAWVRASRGGRAALAELESGDEVRVLAAASHALRFDEEVIDGAARLVSAAAPGRSRTALAACLVAARGRSTLSSALLWALVAEAGAARPLALRALAARDNPDIGEGVASYLDHPDPLLREHVARGLGESEHPSAVGHLGRRLDFETDETVRRAIVMALGAHHGQAVSQWLDRTARLDSSSRVRALARLALAGVPLADAARGNEFLWTELRSAGTGPVPAEAAASLRVAPGLAMPVFADPAGVIVISGLPSSHLGIRLQ